MTSTTTFLKRVPGQILRSYFEKALIPVGDIDWSGKPRDLAKLIPRLQDKLPDEARARLLNDVERMCGISDAAGQAALFGVVSDHSNLDSLPSGHARSAWMFVNEPALFRRAEEARYSDERRRG